MCTVVVDRRPGADWPVVLAANRDERLSRPWRPPARHWDDRPDVIGGFDDAAGGSWIALNDDGVAAVVLNRRDSLGPEEGKRSRGELVLEAVDHADADAAGAALRQLNGAAYRPFNLLVVDNRSGVWIANRPGRGITVAPVPDGVSLLAADDLNDAGSPRDRFRADLAAKPRPDPETGDWEGWIEVMARRDPDPRDGALGAMTIVTDRDYGTVSSSLIGLPAPGLRIGDGRPARPVWLFAAGRPGEAPWHAVTPAGQPEPRPQRRPPPPPPPR